MSILITGGAGYIGTHTLVELSNANHDFISKLSISLKEAREANYLTDKEATPNIHEDDLI